MQMFLIVGSLATYFQMGLAQDQKQQLVIQGVKPTDFNRILECLAALPAIAECGADILNILEGRQNANQYALSKNCCGAIFNIAAKCDLARLRIDPEVTRSILEACARGAASPPTGAVDDKSTGDKDFSWPNLY